MESSTADPGETHGRGPLNADDRYVVISADCHGGGEIHEYRDFLASQYHDEFDAWVDGYEILVPRPARRSRASATGTPTVACATSRPTASSPRSSSRTRSRRSSPVARSVTQAPPTDAHDLELRWAGLQAHNRWLADFCARTPGRRAGIAQILLHDVDASVEEIRWAHANGLTGGVLLPGAPPASGCCRCTTSTTSRSGGVRGARHAGQPPRRQRGSAARARSRKTS